MLSAQNVARELCAEEYDHVAFFQNTLGSAAPTKPQVPRSMHVSRFVQEDSTQLSKVPKPMAIPNADSVPEVWSRT